SVLGSSAAYTGSVEVGDWGFNVVVDQVKFNLLGGLVTLEGGLVFNQRSTHFDLTIPGMTATLNLPGLGQSASSVSGYIASDGRFELDGEVTLDFGSQSAVRLRGDANIHIS